MNFDDPFEGDETPAQKRKRYTKVAGGVAMIVVGLPLIPFPLPVGGVVTFGGIYMVVNNSKRARSLMGSTLARYPKLGKRVRHLFKRKRS